MGGRLNAPAQLRIVGPDGMMLRCEQPGAITALLQEAKLPLNTRCGERGTCRSCQIQLVEGSLQNEHGAVVTANGRPTTVQGCKSRWTAQSSATIRVPARSLLVQMPQVVDTFKLNITRADDPIWQQHDVTDCPADAIVARVAQRLNLADASHLRNSVTQNDSRACFATVERQPRGWTLTKLSAQADAAPLGVAIDIGTTTVAMLLVELATGRVVGRAAALNPQASIGDDVLTRINACAVDSRMVSFMQRKLIDQALSPLLGRMLAEQNIANQRIRVMTVAGNTTMLHLLAGINPASMGIAPFTPDFLEHRRILARDVGWNIDASLHLLPGGSAYVGADITAGSCATGLIYDEGPSVLADIGTNGEMVLKVAGKTWGCATAAGPAFEGVGLLSGMTATRGAIDHITSGTGGAPLDYHVIGDAEPEGLCGSAYIDLLAVGRADGWLTETGRLDADALAAIGLEISCAHPCGRAVVVHDRDTPIVLHEADVARLMQAKAAIAAGISTLLAQHKLAPEDVKRLYLAGGFGLHIDVANAIAIGLFPGFKSSQIQSVGNSSLAGAYLTLLDSTLFEAVAQAGRDMHVIELNQDPSFEDCYIDHLRLTPG